MATRTLSRTAQSRTPTSHSVARKKWRRPASLITPSGETVPIDKDKILFGSSRSADICINTPGVFSEHARIERRGQQLFAIALAQEEEGTFDAKTFTWLDGNMLRKGTSYLLGSGTNLAIGQEANIYKVIFDQGTGRNALMETMLQGMTATAPDDVKKVLQDFLKRQ